MSRSWRYASDRPEFLFGVDMNNNGIIDRFENDDLPTTYTNGIGAGITSM